MVVVRGVCLKGESGEGRRVIVYCGEKGVVLVNFGGV